MPLLIFHYHQNLPFISAQLEWLASTKPGTVKGDKVEGNFDMPEISFENDMDEHEVKPHATLS